VEAPPRVANQARGSQNIKVTTVFEHCRAGSAAIACSALPAISQRWDYSVALTVPADPNRIGRVKMSVRSLPSAIPKAGKTFDLASTKPM
jgi:hypothetical protein